ncbi:MAG: polysaccharide deacetylase family protein [Flavobacterium sp.]|uniref:polysaccharide deacetylase family protein n=1 Tax=Flavobacterium sp. TaxID=239 RepID=UPI003266056E
MKKFYKTIKTLIFARKGNEISILTYHGLVNKITNARLQRNFHTISQFESHILFLKKKQFRFLNATELAYYIDNPKEIKSQKMVCITFDDGYQNNLEAIEILEKNKASGIFFITTDAINSQTSIWTVNLSLLLLEGSINKINFNNKEYQISTYDERLSVFNIIRNQLKKVNSKTRNILFNEILKQFPENELEQLLEKNNYFKMLTWDEIKEVQNENIQFHSHGHFHEIHHEIQDIKTLKNEISTSKKIIEKNLKNNVFLFAYPNGNYNANSFNFLDEAGYKGAFVLQEEKYTEKFYKYNIPRITPNGKINKFKNQMLN